MTAAVVLLAYAAFVGTLGAAWLRRANWPERAPRLAILTWQALAWSVLASVVLAGLVLAVPVGMLSGDLAGLLQTCVMLLREQYSTPGGAVVSTAGLLAALGVAARFAYCLAASALTSRAGRARHREQLALVGRSDDRLDAIILDHAVCAAYCVPGRRGRVVLTTATLEALDTDQIAAVLAHERAHLRGRHHLVVSSMSSLRRAFPFVPAFAWAADEVARLTEMVADDAAAVRAGGDRLTLATALVRLAEGATPVGALGAGGSSAVARVRRLARPAPALGVRARVCALTGIAILGVVPIMVSAAPALAVASSAYCPISLHS